MRQTTLPLVDEFLLNLQANNYSKETLYSYEKDLVVFENFFKELKIDFSKLTKKDILNYKAYLTSIDRKTANKIKGRKKLTAYSINRMLSSLRSIDGISSQFFSPFNFICGFPIY